MIKISGVFNDVAAEIDVVGNQLSKVARPMSRVHNTLQALNMAFASSVAEIAVAEEGGASLSVRLPSMHTPIVRSRRAALPVPY
jgi:hypothetical protein